ncbi:MAG: tRNA (adenosine(37)-N6)-threonylcarbamoyltransferase complex ATPase subunit type 1 TsaE [Gammaproteobacteria bacterium]
MSEVIRWSLDDEQGTRALGEQLGAAILGAGTPGGGFLVRLEGDLGAGKTTLVRALIQSLGHEGPVRSPTYTLVEPYELTAQGRGDTGGAMKIVHMDLYRLADPEELEFLGIRDLLTDSHLLLVEWPQKGEGLLPRGDLRIRLSYSGDGREVELEPLSDRARSLRLAND